MCKIFIYNKLYIYFYIHVENLTKTKINKKTKTYFLSTIFINNFCILSG